jgi:pimeloyl-ACP methyl ester carboxylesterase
MTQTPVVLLHGYYHGAWCWTDVVLALAAAGRAAVPVDMAGHGLRARRPVAATARPFDESTFATEKSPLGDIDLEAAADLLIRQIAAIGRGAPTTVVAHSMGGAVLTRAAERAPHLMAHLVYLTAYMPASGRACITYVSLPEAKDSVFMRLVCGDPMASGAMRVDPFTQDPQRRDGLREAFYGDVEQHKANAAIALLGCDAPTLTALQATELTAKRWGAIDRTYVICTKDRTIPPALQRLFITQADDAFPDNPTKVQTLESSHSPFLSMPERVAELLVTLA